jgi:hypothetical protein
MDGREIPPVRASSGYSNRHWEGDTLVIEASGVTAIISLGWLRCSPAGERFRNG